jgi:hypothetical protein
MTTLHRVRLLRREKFTGASREVALDVIRRWADGRARKATACGLYGRS